MHKISKAVISGMVLCVAATADAAGGAPAPRPMSPELQAVVAQWVRATQTCEQFDRASAAGRHACADAGQLQKAIEARGWAIQDAARQLNDICQERETVYQLAAGVRDSGRPPAAALTTIQSVKWIKMPSNDLKSAINLVYFDPDLQALSPLQIQMAAHSACLLGPDPTWQPLR